MTVSVRKMSLGSGYEYLIRSVARGDVELDPSTPLTRYYAESGTPPGYWLGAGLAGLGDGLPEGSEVSEEQLFRLLGMLQDPLTGQPLGQRPGANAVAGFDLTFSVPKSVSAVWAITDAATQEVIHRAHRDAIATVLAYAEKNILLTRTGAAGTVQVPIRGVIAAAFEHWDSRAGDPHLHTHVVIANRVQDQTGTWRSLDARVLFAYVVALSEMHEGVLQDLLSERLGYGWVEHSRRHSPVPRWEIDGVPKALLEEFSSRSRDIEDAKNQLVGEFVEKHGRAPTDVEVLRLRQQATLQTRPDKQQHSLAEQTESWRERARPFLEGEDTVTATRELADRNPLPVLTAAGIDEDLAVETAQIALATVAGKRATFTQANVLAEVHRRLHGAHFATPRERLDVAVEMTRTALGEAVVLTPDSANVAAVRYTSPHTLQAESRLLEAGRSLAGPVAPSAVNSTVITGPEPSSELVPDVPVLGMDQAAAALAIATSGRELDLLVGPAGSGKTHTLSALRQVWEDVYGEGAVTGLAPSAAAAQVLADELGIDADNTAKWVYEQTRQNQRIDRIAELYEQMEHVPSRAERDAIDQRIDAIHREYMRWMIGPAQLVIIDEAGLAGTTDLDTIVAQAREAEAKVLLVGDWGQLGSVQAGGAFAMLVNDRPDVPELSTVRRFTNDWEKDATLLLRVGDAEAIDVYTDHDRVHAGGRDQVLDQLYAAWRTDTESGLSSLMIAADTEAVTALNHRAQADRIAVGEVQPEGVPVSSGAAGVGDRIVTRHNDRRLITDGRWVRNGDHWTVHATDPDGSLTARLDNRGDEDSEMSITLPSEYVREHVELGYATTTHRAQGSTVDTAHALINDRSTREALYVAATRGRQANHLYIDLNSDPDPDTGHAPNAGGDATEILRGVLERTDAEQAAHAVMGRARSGAGGGSASLSWGSLEDPRMAAFLRTDLFPRHYDTFEHGLSHEITL